MKKDYYNQITKFGLQNITLPKVLAKDIFNVDKLELLPLLNAAYEVRKEFVGKSVTIHIINNSQNGFCSEDCHYCAQAKTSDADISEYPMKTDDEIMMEAKQAYERGAHRYCMVFAGRGPSDRRVEHLARLIRLIKSQYPIEICVSAGLLDKKKAQILKMAGLDRLNHNLNTSENHYESICTTHTFRDRLGTLEAARNAGLQLCSGIIVGMNEAEEDIIEVAYKLRELEVESIPINFLIPIEGNQLRGTPLLTPDFCLRVLCLFRFVNPNAEIRIAAGREMHLRSMEVLALYPANSLFLDGYLNTKGEERKRTLQMIKDAGFTIESTQNIDDLINEEIDSFAAHVNDPVSKTILKNFKDLRPLMNFKKSPQSH